MFSDLWFIGTGEFAALCLENFQKENVNFSKIITGLPTRSGRNNKELPSHVEIFASKNNLEVTRTGLLSKNESLISDFNAKIPDLIFVIDFGQIIREPFLNGAKFGCLNIHPSILPRWRGAAPIQRALLNGDEKIGVSVFKLVQKMDAGNIFFQTEFQVQDSDSAKNLYEKLAQEGVKLAKKIISSENNFSGTEQDDSLATYANKLEKSEFEISFDLKSQDFFNKVRALNMSGGAFIKLKNNKRMKIFSVKKNILESKIKGEILSLENNPVISCADFSLEFLEVQPESKKIMSGKQWADGLRLKIHDVI